MRIFTQKNFTEFKNGHSPFLNKEELLTYIALQKILKIDKHIYYTDCISLSYELNGDDKEPTRYDIIMMRNGLKGLCKKGIIKIENVKSTLRYKIDMSNIINESNENFTVISDYELDILLKYCKKCNVDKYNLLLYFLNIIGTIDHSKGIYDNTDINEKIKGKVGYMPIKYLADISDISINTANRYNKILEDINLLYIRRSNLIYIVVNGIKSYNNHYGRFCDKDVINNFAEQYEKEKIKINNTFVTNKKKSDGKRSKTMKLNKLLNNFDEYIAQGKYSKNDLIDLYIYARKRNEEIMEQINDKNCFDSVKKMLIRKIYDLSKFEELDIIKDVQ